jgi:hypothetical protein
MKKKRMAPKSEWPEYVSPVDIYNDLMPGIIGKNAAYDLFKGNNFPLVKIAGEVKLLAKREDFWKWAFGEEF